MTRFIRRLAADVVAVALIPMAASTVAVPGVSSAQCDPNWSRNVWTNECKPPPPPPPWYKPPPPYAPVFAPQWTPPPPPAPPWAPTAIPVWEQGHQQWGVYVGPVWVPI